MFTRGFPEFPRCDIKIERDSNKTCTRRTSRRKETEVTVVFLFTGAHATLKARALTNTFSREAKLDRCSRTFERSVKRIISNWDSVE